MATTTNLGLYKPSRDDYISVTRDISDNMDIIDAAVGENQTDIGAMDDALIYTAVQVGDNWQLPNGTDASIGDFVILNGVWGHATAVITGGSTNIVENTNWVAETSKILNNIPVMKSQISSLQEKTNSVSYTSVMNLNNMTEGFAVTNANTANNPTSHAYLVLAFSVSSYTAQLAFRLAGTTIFFRTKSNAWNNWVQITTA